MMRPNFWEQSQSALTYAELEERLKNLEGKFDYKMVEAVSSSVLEILQKMLKTLSNKMNNPIAPFKQIDDEIKLLEKLISHFKSLDLNVTNKNDVKNFFNQVDIKGSLSKYSKEIKLQLVELEKTVENLTPTEKGLKPFDGIGEIMDSPPPKLGSK